PIRREMHLDRLSYAVALPDRPAPDHAWLYHRVLGHAADDDGASSFRRCHARLHSGRASIRRAGPDEYPRRSLQGLPARGIDAGSNPETQIVPRLGVPWTSGPTGLPSRYECASLWM